MRFNRGMITPLRFHPYEPALAGAFEAINTEWLEELFEVEESDVETLQNPDRIVAAGGEIWFAELMNAAKPGDPLHVDSVVGCAALRRIEPPLAEPDEGLFELTKMGVLASARGNKVGEPLLLQVLERARENPAIRRLFLLTSKKCEAAIHLYEKHGWQHDQAMLDRFGHVYRRSNVGMIYPDVWAD